MILGENIGSVDTLQAVFPAVNNPQFRDFLRNKWYLCGDRFSFHNIRGQPIICSISSDLTVCKEFIDKEVKVVIRVKNEIIEQCM